MSERRYLYRLMLKGEVPIGFRPPGALGYRSGRLSLPMH